MKVVLIHNRPGPDGGARYVRMPPRAKRPCTFVYDTPGIGGVDGLAGDPGFSWPCEAPATHRVKADPSPYDPDQQPYRALMCQRHAEDAVADMDCRAYRFRSIA